MADLAEQSSVSNIPSIFGKLIFIPNLYFIYFTFNLIKTNPQTAIQEFVRVRDLLYVVYIPLFIIIGLLILILQRQDKNSSILKNLRNLLPNLILSLILTTFSYAIAKYLNDLLILVNR